MSTQTQNAHLSEEAALRWQVGEATAAERQHVDSCIACQTQTQPLHDALHLFGAAARAWGETKAAESHRINPHTDIPATMSHGWRTMTATWAAVAAVLLLMLGIGLPRWQAHRNALQAQMREQQARQELAQDNALLEAVDQDVSQVVPQAMAPLSGVNTSSSGSATQSTQMQEPQTQTQ